MAQAKIYWNRENYNMVEKIFRKSVEFCNEHDTWKLNVAHVLFMQENKYKEAIGFYEPIVKKHYDNVSAARSEMDSDSFHRCSVFTLQGQTVCTLPVEGLMKVVCFHSLAGTVYHSGVSLQTKAFGKTCASM